jgi:CheY-like chemotaxis protein
MEGKVMSAPHTNEAQPAALNLRVLVVDDSEIDARLLVRELQRFGYAPIWERVDTADKLQAALTRQAWDIILCDYRMPRFSGLEALEVVRAQDPDLPLILVSGSIGEELAVAAIRAGASDYLLKDRLARLGSAVQRSLQEAEQRQSRRRTEDQLRLLLSAVERRPDSLASTGPAGDLARDFNNFLGAIIVNAQLARAAADADTTVAERLDCIIEAGRQAASLARQILALSGRDERPRRPLQRGSVVPETLRPLQPTLPAHVELEAAVPATGRAVLANATPRNRLLGSAVGALLRPRTRA